MRSIPPSLLSILLLLSGGMSPALAQSTLTSAQVYKVSNTVDIDRQNQGVWSPAAIGDGLVPRDALRTGSASRAELLFNEGTLVRTGEGTTFRFPEGRRSMELVDGTALIMIRPGQGDSQVKTPQATIVAHGTALFVQHDPTRNATIVGVLTENEAGPVTVADLTGERSVQLTAGQFVSVANGVVGLVENFILPLFYQGVDLAVGLGTGQERSIEQESAEVQQTINAVRAETLQPLSSQIVWLQDFCAANAGTLQGVLQNTPLLQLIFPASIPPPEVSVEIPDSDLIVTPVRSVAGILWIGNYCLGRSNTP